MHSLAQAVHLRWEVKNAHLWSGNAGACASGFQRSAGTWGSSRLAVAQLRKQERSAGVRRQMETLQVRASAAAEKPESPVTRFGPVMVNDCMGKMGRASAEAAVEAGLQLVPYSLTGGSVLEDEIDVKGVKVKVHDKSERESVMDKVLIEYPKLVVVDYTVPMAVNDNAEFYCRRGVPFVMGTTGGDRLKLMDVVQASGNFAVISPQMGKQVVAFQAAMEIMAEQFPGAFSGYTLKVTESHQASKLDTSGTAKAIIGSFVKLGLDFDIDEVELIRDREEQTNRIGVPEEFLNGHAFHTYRVVSPDQTVAFEFQHNVCGRSIYAQGTVDAVLFLMKKIEEQSEKKVYNMIDVLREGSMR